jgi:hypothetical protein
VNRLSGVELTLIAVMIICVVVYGIQTARGVTDDVDTGSMLFIALLVLLLARRNSD